MTHFTPDEAATRQLRKSALATIATLSLFLGMFGLGCSFTVDTKELNGGDEYVSCGTDTKKCPVDLEDPDGPKECVDATSPQFGCATSSCKPCELEGATVRCTPAGDCGISKCDEDNLDCDGVTANGCEVESDRDLDHCGACRRPCNLSNASPGCVQGRCVVSVCINDHLNCDNDDSNGCETPISNDNCGKCGITCEVDQTCVDGECM